MSESAKRPWETEYRVAETKIVAETPDLRVLEITLDAGEAVPWHLHRNVDDRFYCLAGAIAVLTRKPDEEFHLGPGDTCLVPTGRAHEVRNAAAEHPSRFLIVQGPGEYDFVPVPER
ncbi:MAG: cupin domain-containing protein [Alphaproteobacteria bacterium]|nr:cupin domain-containing protein [Alphaproteobacteria bacterium]